MQQIAKTTGRVLILTGVITGLFWALAGRLGSFAGAAVTRDSLWIPAQTLHVLGAVLAVFGLIGLQALYGTKTGSTGMAGFVLSIAGALCFFADGVIALVLFPVLGAADARLFQADGAMNSPPVFLMFVAFAVVLMFGYVAFAVALGRADVRMRKPALLLIAGAILSNLPPGPVSPAIIAAGGIAWSMAMLWVGLTLRRDPSAAA
ncbi:MAG: hypothetical protein K2X03_03850 [Bryobacteraceae bacterium]|nr:hypothetical protein [Bryobacteraceae bacterium]